MLLSKIYKDAIIYGPYFNKSTGRWIVEIDTNNQKERINYARFKIQEYLGRLLTTLEEVDHKDENKTNDDISNLQILSKEENVIKTHQIYTQNIIEVCFKCDRKFVMTPLQQKNRKKNENKGNNGPFCSRKCASIYGRQLMGVT